MNEVHIVMQGKGGVGKSYVALNLAQFLKARDNETLCIDTDPLTPTLIRYEALSPKYVQIADQATMRIEEFDEMMEMIVNTSSDVLIDTGSSTFLPLSKYIIDYNVLELLTGTYNKNIIVHVVINAQTNNDLLATVTCFDAIARQFPENAKIIVWLNEFGGSISTPDGQNFENMQAFIQNRHRVVAIIKIPDPDELTLKDIAAMQNERLTYTEIRLNPNFRMMSKSRLFKVENYLFNQLRAINWQQCWSPAND